MELEVTSAFPKLIGRFRVPDAQSMNRDLQALILAEEASYQRLGRSNIRVLHSQTDFLARPEPAVEALATWVDWAVGEMVDATAGPGALSGSMSVSAWATICRAGAYHAPHSHSDSAWSGVYYVDAGTNNLDHPLSGVLEFLDPRAGIEAVTAPGDPYGEPLRVRRKDSAHRSLVQRHLSGALCGQTRRRGDHRPPKSRAADVTRRLAS